MSRSMSLALVALLGGCTFNVSSFARDVSSTAPDVPSRLTGDFSHISHLSGFGVRVEGGETVTTTTAVLTIGGLLGAGGDVDAVTRGVHIDWPNDPSMANARRITVGYDGPALETVWTEGVTLTLPSTTALELAGGSTSIEVSGVTAPMHLTTDS